MALRAARRTRWTMTLAGLAALGAAPGALAAASVAITAPGSAARNAPLTLRVSGVAPPNVAGDPVGGQATVIAWVQLVSDGNCPAQQPDFAPPDAWGFNHDQETIAAGVAFSRSWSADSSGQRFGQYEVCAWTLDDRFNTAATAQAPLTIRPPVLHLSVSVPRHARVGTRGTFTATASLETSSRVGILLLPPRAVVCDASGVSCRMRRLSSCPANYRKADDLVGNIQAGVTPFAGASFADPVHDYRGRVRFSSRLKALSAGRFHFCAYALEDPGDAPPPYTEVHASAAFQVAG